MAEALRTMDAAYRARRRLDVVGRSALGTLAFAVALDDARLAKGMAFILDAQLAAMKAKP